MSVWKSSPWASFATFLLGRHQVGWDLLPSGSSFDFCVVRVFSSLSSRLGSKFRIASNTPLVTIILLWGSANGWFSSLLLLFCLGMLLDLVMPLHLWLLASIMLAFTNVWKVAESTQNSAKSTRTGQVSSQFDQSTWFWLYSNEFWENSNESSQVFKIP